MLLHPYRYHLQAGAPATSLRGQPTALGQWLLGAAVSDSVGGSHGHDDVILLLL